MASPFEIKKEDLDRLDPKRSVDLIRDLVHVEASVSGIKKSKINIPADINTNDGGIDGEVKDAERDGVNGIIKKGTTMYQIKSGRFSGKSGVKNILFTKRPSELKSGIRACFEAGGTFIVAFTGWDAPTANPESVEKEFAKQAKEAGYERVRIEIWRQNTIIGFLKTFPALCLTVKEMYDYPLRLHDRWHNMADMNNQIHLGDKQHEFVDSMKSELRKNKHAHIRVTGEPGIGKTRLVLEATNTDDLRPAVIYFDKPSDLLERGFMNHICTGDPQIRTLLVVDECDFTNQARIWNDLKYNALGTSLITIFSEAERSSETIPMPAPPLEDNDLGEIIKGYIGNDPNISRWIYWCGSSPRVAHVVGKNLKYSPQDILKSPAEVDVWGRYIADMETPSPKVETRRKILLWISLFKRFGFETPHSAEAAVIAKIIQREEGIRRSEFNNTIHDLRKRKILQGNTTLYITPKLLHLYLWTEWWKIHDIDMFYSTLELILSEQKNLGDNNLLRWSLAMFVYGKQSPKVIEVSREILASGELLDSYDMLKTPLGADFFLTLCNVVPDDALACLERVIGKRTRDELLEFEIGRRSVVLALEKIVSRGGFFDGVSRVLLKLAEAENENIGNSATNVFQGMFNIDWPAGKPDAMMRLLKTVMDSDSSYVRAIATGACNVALKGGTSVIIIDPDDPEPMPKPYIPDRDEAIRYRLQVLDLLKAGHNGNMHGEAAKVILDNARSLIRLPEFTESMIDALERVQNAGENDEKLVKCISAILKFSKPNKEITKNLKAILDRITGTSFHSMLQRYVGMSGHINTIGTSWQDNQEKEIGELAKTATDPHVLKPELSWLVTSKAKHGYRFGYELAKLDPRWLLLPVIMDALREAKDEGANSFVGGYLRRVHEEDVDRWDAELDAIYDDEEMCRLLPDLTSISGVTDGSVRRVIRGMNDKRFGCGAMNAVRNSGFVSEETFVECMNLLIKSQEDDAAFIALDLFYSRFVHQKKAMPKDIALRILLHDNVINHTSTYAEEGRGEWEWQEIGSEFVGQYPDDGIRVLETVINGIDDAALLVPDRGKGYVLEKIIRAHPIEAWDILSRHIGPSPDKKAYMLRQWLAGPLPDRTNSIMFAIPISRIVAWVNEDDKIRAAYAASFLPPDLGHVREFLVEYGDRQDVQAALAGNFGNGIWEGSAVAHYQDKKIDVENRIKNEEDPNVLSCLRFYAKHMEERTKRISDMEERIP